ncbi:MAG TPA: DinB family protein [Gemmatimonadales bacterium]
MDHLRRLLAHLVWADDRAHDAIAAASPTQGAEATALYAHILAAEHVWLRRLEERPPEVDVWPTLTLPEAQALAAANRVGLTTYLDGLAPADLNREIRYVNSAGQAFTSKIEDILLHVCLHGAYHRGQVGWLLRRAGAIPAPTDYIAYVRGAPAATRQG